jgi:hypothetical protein
VPVRRVAWFSVSGWIAYLLEPQLCRNFRILGVTNFFWLFVAPKKKKTSRRLRSFKRISYEDLLPDPFQRIRRVSCFSGLFFFASPTGPPSGEPHRTPKDDAGGSGQIVPEYHIAPTGTEPPFCSCRVSPLSRPQPFFGKEITSLLLFHCLSLLCRVFYLVCVCNLEFKIFFDNIICKSDAGNLRVAF